MKTKLPWILVAVLAAALGFTWMRAPHPASGAVPAAEGRGKKVLYWIDAMNPTHKYDKAGKAPDGMDLVPVYAEGATPAGEKKVLYWVDPMHPAYKSDKPGIAPDCGMQLVPVYADGNESAATSTVRGYANVKLTPDRRQLIGVQTGMTEMRSLGRSVRTVGRIAVDETRLYKISTKFDGYIEKPISIRDLPGQIEAFLGGQVD